MHCSLYFTVLALSHITIVLCTSRSCDLASRHQIAVESTDEEYPCDINGNITKYTISDLGEVVTSCTTVYFCSLTSTVRLNDVLVLEHLHDIRFVGLNETVIHCKGKSGFLLTNMTNLTLESLTFTKCAHNYSMFINYRGEKRYWFTSGLILLNSTNATFKEVTVRESRGIGITVLNTRGPVSFEQCVFEGNGERTIRGGTGLFIEISKYHNITYQDVNDSVYNLSSCTFRNNIAFEKDMKSTPFGRGGGVRIYIRDGSSNNTILVHNCTFYNNTASRWGGGFFASIHDTATDNAILVQNSNFTGNSSPMNYGGATYVGFQCGNVSRQCLNNSYTFHSCSFVQNRAQYGGGSVFTSTRISSIVPPATHNKIIHSECEWIDNTAQYGSAIAILPDTWSLIAVGSLPTPVFKDSTVKGNNVIDSVHTDNTLDVHNPYEQKSMGVGAIYCTLYRIQFERSLLLEDNTGTGITSSSCLLFFMKGSRVEFHRNSGYAGGAVYLLGYSTIYINNNSSFTFINNTAETNGGAICYHSSDIIEHLYSYNCFISKPDSARSNTVTFTFSGNKAGMGNEAVGYGDSIYVTSLLPCIREYNLTTSNNNYSSLLSNIAMFTFTKSSKNSISTEINKFSTNTTKQMQRYIPVIPGKHTTLDFEGLDDLLHTRRAPYILTVSNNKNYSIKSQSYRTYITNKAITLLGSPGDEGNVTLSTITQFKTALSFRVKMQPCPPGYIVIRNSCVCSSDTTTPYVGISMCNKSIFRAHMIRGFWYGYLENTPLDNGSAFITGYCPKGFCYNNHEYLPGIASKELLDHTICRNQHTGVLCTECQDNTSMYYHSDPIKCDVQHRCHLGWLLFIVSEIVPATVLFLIIITFNVSFTSGYWTGFVLYAQVIGLFQLSAHDRIKTSKEISNAKSIIEMIYDTFNLLFFNHDTFSFCLSRNGNTLDLLAIRYVTFIYSFCLVISIILVLRICNITQIKLLFKCRVHSVQTSIVHSLSAFLVLCFAECAKISIKMLSYGFILGKRGKKVKTVAYMYAVMDWFGPKHLKYVIPTSIIAFIIVCIPLYVLLIHPLSCKFLNILKLSENRVVLIFNKLIPIEKLKPFQDSFQGGYKDNFRFMSGLYFLYRILILLNVAMNYIEYFFITLEVQLILMFLIHAVVQPYKKTAHNIIDSLLFANMAIINGLSLHNFTKAQTLKGLPKSTTFVTLVQVQLMALPLLCVIVCLIYFIAKTIHAKCSNPMPELSTHNDDLLEYCDMSPSRTEGEEQLITESNSSIYYNTFDY